MQTAFRRYVRLYGGRRSLVIGFVVASLAQVATLVPLPFLVGSLFDGALADQELRRLVTLAVVMLLLQMVSSVAGITGTRWILLANTRVVSDLRRTVFDKLYWLSLRYHDTTPMSSLHDRIVNETDRVDLMTRAGYTVAVPAGMTSVGMLGVLALVSWRLFIVAVAVMPVVYGLSRLTTRRLRRATVVMHGSIDDFSRTTFATLRSIRQSHILGRERQARSEEDTVIDATARATLEHGLARRLHLEVSRIALSAWAVVILTIGAAGVVNEWLTLGELLAFYAGLALVRQPLNQLTISTPAIVAGQEAVQRVFELLDVDEPNPYSGTAEIDLDGQIAVARVTFAYEADAPVLSDVSLAIEPGEVVALVGPNGSGKTSLSNLILGLYRPASGSVTIDGHEMADVDLNHYRRQIGVLAQHPMLIPGSVADNITVGRPELTRADAADALGFIGSNSDEGVPISLDASAYENGPLLSGGQLQRVALARALVGDPRLLILDEPSNHLDADGLQRLLSNLRSSPSTPAMLLITHEQQVADLADRVYRLVDGRITVDR